MVCITLVEPYVMEQQESMKTTLLKSIDYSLPKPTLYNYIPNTDVVWAYHTAKNL